MPRNIDQSKKKLCPICNNKYSPNTFNKHFNSCKSKATVSEPIHNRSDSEDTFELPRTHGDLAIDFDLTAEDYPHDIFVVSNDNNIGLAQYDHGADSSESSSAPEADDVQIQYHPKSGRPMTTLTFDDFFNDKLPKSAHIPSNNKPWRPWQSRTDFEVAALALDCFMNEQQTNRLITLIHRVARGLDNFSLKDYNEVQRTWDLAAERSTKFQREELRVQYRDEEPEKYELFYRPVWDWLMELVSSKEIVSPNQWWTIQDRLPAGAVPLGIIFYADKSKLSSFGTAKGYPVIVRCANLPMNIRNGSGVAGGRVVGWLPVVTEDAHRSGKTDFADFKTVVWHTSISKLFEGLTIYCSTGYARICGDGIRRNLFPVCIIESSDFEEQCVICLTRGVRSLVPCVKCLVPHDQLNNLEAHHAKRSARQTIEILNEARQSESKAASKELLKKFGLRPHFNTFFKLANGNPFEAASFDDLHFQDSGLWSDHIFEEAKFQLERLPGVSSRSAKAKIDAHFKNFPRWSGLHHFESGVVKVNFNDGSKHRDISKSFLFAAHDVLVESKTKAGYLLLKIMRRYINTIMYAGLDIHTSETIELGRASVYITKTTETERSRNFNVVKLHYHQHLYDDIENKGVLRGMSTRPNEKFHGPLRKIYLRQTNFKDTGKQIARIEHQNVVSTLIQGEIEDYDDYLSSGKGNYDIPDDIETLLHNAHIHIGSKLKPISFAQLESESSLFRQIHIRAADFMSNLLPTSGIPLPHGERIKFTVDSMVVPFQFLKVNYESLETWHIATDFLRCNPAFFGKPRYDSIVFNAGGRPVFAQLRYLFLCTVADVAYPIALVQSYKVLQARSAIDKDLGLLRVRKERDTEFISVRSIICGAVLIPASDDPLKIDEMLVWDALDGDMFLRVKESFPGYTTAKPNPTSKSDDQLDPLSKASSS
ncbi:hypothetical protein F5878DRAFT_697660 [Lentinula raphanica]|uniref:Uncharacterized protein n=1 Tax=Lentinula raphanica TaxID=153919 RepID=A0AA38P0N1_9AGAR|nr:hypothetical protein F5878DRAFT_697660 [Lentinula raphanica]